ncbi:carbohydrate ABC transporter permease [Paenibacillus macerans]|nr:carbohydrate ABC transporter permease [Paenibacillus macerans]MCY7561321.1 carbohydrate ABC transporter permease [Paenibacillus macerans]MEC0149284.1 carbohydrate ABC transporter permease [Paenibacillus macerans]UMV45207.1 carbohydrate ABC transporter permease [Paenibacillus macerans]
MAKILVYVFLIVITLLNLFPVVVMIFTSLKGNDELISGAFSLLPHDWHFENYLKAMESGKWGLYFKNSLIVTLVVTAGSLLFNTLAGYTFARIRFRGSTIIFVCLLAGMMVPAQSIVVPQFIIMKSIPLFGHNDIWGQGGTGWLNTYYALIIPALSGSIGIFMARQFFSGFPKDLDEAGYMDGLGYFGTYLRIFLPLSGPLMATLGILKIVSVWNEFFQPLIFTNTESMRTIQLALSLFKGEFTIQYNLLMAATVLVSLPMLVAFLLFQKQFVGSIVSSGVKG